MIKHSDQEIVKRVQEIFDEIHKREYCMGWDSSSKITVSQNTAEKIVINIESMYEVPQPSLPALMQMAEFFGTKNINPAEQFYFSGCDTCDYGSRAGYSLRIEPEVA